VPFNIGGRVGPRTSPESLEKYICCPLNLVILNVDVTVFRVQFYLNSLSKKKILVCGAADNFYFRFMFMSICFVTFVFYFFWVDFVVLGMYILL